MMQKIDERNPAPKYYQLENLIQERILFSGLQPGERLPSVRRLIEEYSVSLGCVRQALLNLKRKKVISMEQGRRTTVLSLPKDIRTRNIIFLLCRKKCLDPFYSKVLRGVEKAIRKRNIYHLSYYQVDLPKEEKEFFSRTVPHFKDNLVDGVILVGVVRKRVLRELDKSGVPVVLIGDHAEERCFNDEKSMSLQESNFFGSFQATSHLIGIGHKKIAYIGVSQPYFWWKQRFNGYRYALLKNNIPLEEKWISLCSTEEDRNEGYKAMQKILSASRSAGQRSQPTALFVSDVRLAIGAMKKLREVNLHIPKDLSVTTYGNLGLASLADPPLTTVEFSEESLGEKAANTIFDDLSRREPKFRKIHIPSQLVVRLSTARINKGGEL
jgi:LacI family transcriptional regulator